jgi:capsular polysaccharide export protein
LDGFLREHPRPLVAVSSWEDGLERFFPGGRLCPFGADDEETRRADLLVCWLHADLDWVAAVARRTGQPVLLAEDAFLKSVLTVARPGPRRYQANVAVFFDDLGYHYAGARPSRLEVLLNSVDLGPEEIRRGAAIREKLVRNRLTKYNHQPPLSEELGRPGRKKVLVVDQSFGDASVTEGLASPRTFRLMLKTALEENPEADVIVKKHPDAIAQEAKSRRRRRSYFQGLRPEGRIFPLTVEANPYSVIERVEAVYTVSSQMGLEALMAGKPVHVFGLPAYAGWGLTIDYLQCGRRTRIRTLNELVYIIYGLYTRYAGPNGETWQAEDAIDYLLQLREEYFSQVLANQ